VSGCGFTIQADSLPVLPGLGRDLDLALYAGGDFELLFTVAPERLKGAEGACELSVIGEVTPVADRVTLDGTREIERKGYRSL
jgi:thiamine-monophosphate kinase